jgi:hypothetical protein
VKKNAPSLGASPVLARENHRIASVLSGVCGGSVSTSDIKETKLSRQPRYPKSKLDIIDSDLDMESQRATNQGELVMTVRVRKGRDKSGLGLIVMQDINCQEYLGSVLRLLKRRAPFERAPQ